MTKKAAESLISVKERFIKFEYVPSLFSYYASINAPYAKGTHAQNYAVIIL